MRSLPLAAWAQVVGLALTCVGVRAADLYVAPTGSAAGSGTYSQPCDLATAFSGQVGHPGDTFWLRGGTYKLGHLDTMVHGAPGAPLTFRPVRGEQVSIDGSLNLQDPNGYLVFRDFELYSSDTNRISSQTNAGFSPTDITLIPGMACFSPNVSFINLVIHDQTRHGIYLVESATNTLIYGCIIYNNGWASPDNAEGHGLYIQANIGTRTAANNVVFNNSGVGMHVYENRANFVLSGVVLDGNVAFGAGAIQRVRAYRDWIIGVDAPAAYADNIVIGNNLGFVPAGSSASPQIQIGRDNINGNVIITNNYMPLGLLMNNWQTATVSENFFAPRASSYLINLSQGLTALNADWNNNTYICDPTGGQVLLNATPYSFSGWQSATGYDWDSTFAVGELGGVKVFVMPNQFEPGRATIVAYNWNNLNTISVDVSSVLPLGSQFEVRNVQNFFGDPVLSGTFQGQRLQLPMSNLAVAPPDTAALVTPPPTGPTFNVFLLQVLLNPLRITQVGNSVQVSWPFKAGSDALQSTANFMDPGSWSYSAQNPLIIADEYSITEPATSTAKYYRLRPR